MNAEPELLFLFSLRRSGSTMSQRILVSHPDISSGTTEPQILLPFLYALKEKGVTSEYSHRTMAKAVNDFCRVLPNGKEDYFTELRQFILRLYARANKQQTKYVLDKTPVYYLIVEDIIELFPNAKIIFLWRNPLSIISSFLHSRDRGKWVLYRHDTDLFEGLSNMVDACKKYRDRACVVNYEDLVMHPEEAWRRIFAYLDLPFDPALLTKFIDIPRQGRMGDPYGTKKYQSISKEPLEKWKRVLVNPIRKTWCRRYLQWIGRKRLAVMGYNLDELLAELDSIPFSLRFVMSDVVRMPFGLAFRLLRHKVQYRRDQQWVSVEFPWIKRIFFRGAN